MMDFIIANLDWIALAIGTVGSFLWAQNGESAKYASLWWLCSSLLWIAVSYVKGLPAVGARDMIGVSMNLYGGWRWLAHPKPNGMATDKKPPQPETATTGSLTAA
jgi:hypothetical protein